MTKTKWYAKPIYALVALALVLTLSLIPAVPAAADGPVTKNYGDFTLPPGGGTFWLPDVWDLNRCDVTISYRLDLSGAPNVAYTGNYGQAANVGLLSFTTPTAGGRMSGFLADWDNAGVEFPTFPDKPKLQDLDDKFNMQRFPNPGSWSETMYDVYCATDTIAASPFGSWNNYGIWFDRDGVDPWQDADPSTPLPGGSGVPWGSVEGGTYNTGGIYDVQLTFHKNSPTKGTACPLMFPGLANPVAAGGYGIPTGFNPSSPGPGYDDFPAGISFDTDVTRMGTMQVVVQGASGNGTIVVKDLTVTGCLAMVTIDGCDTGVVDQVYDGTTISGKIAECAAAARNHGEFVSCVSHLTNDLVSEGCLTGKEKGKIQRCAAKADIPTS